MCKVLGGLCLEKDRARKTNGCLTHQSLPGLIVIKAAFRFF